MIRRLYRLSELAIFTVPLSRLAWIANEEPKSRFIPIGSNIPSLLIPRQAQTASAEAIKTVAVFGVTPVTRTAWEVEEISRAVREAKKGVPRLRLVVFGRGAPEVSGLFERALRGSGIELTVLGILPARRIAEILSNSDVLLYVRDNLVPQHGCILAAVACGLPVVSYGDSAQCFPLNEAGVLLAPPRNRDAFAAALTQVLSDGELWSSLRERSVEAYKRHFAWGKIAREYVEAFEVAASLKLPEPAGDVTLQEKIPDAAPPASGHRTQGISAR
jgi:glycosyltransferase involved in cell wall biosynthesis